MTLPRPSRQRLKIPRIALRRDLGIRLLAFYMAFVLPLVGIVLYLDRLAINRLRADVETANLALANAVAQETNLSLGSFRGVVKTLGEQDAVLHATPAEMRPLFSALTFSRHEVALVYRLNSQGIMLYHYPETNVRSPTVGIDFSFRDYFKKAQHTHVPFFSHGRISPTTGEGVITAVMPLWNAQEEFIGIVGVNIRLSFLSSALEEVARDRHPEENFVIFIVDDIGQIIAASRDNFRGKTTLLTSITDFAPDLAPALAAQHKGTLIVGEGSDAMLYGYVPLSAAPLGVVVGQSTQSAYLTVNTFRHTTHLALIVVLAAGVLFWLVLSLQVLHPLGSLAKYSRAIGQEGPHTPAQQQALGRLSKRHDQVGHLARTLLRMEADIASRMQELHTLLQTSASVASTLDSHTVLARILAQVERLLGAEKCAIIAWDEQKQAFVARASRGLSPSYAERLIIGRDEFNSLALRALKAQEPLQISDTETDPTAISIRPRARAENYRAVLAVPLPTQHTPLAALVVYYPRPHVFTQREIDLLTSFANHAAMAIENAALFERSDTRLQEQTRRLEALIQSMSDAILLEDHSGRVLYANRHMADLADLTPQDMSGVEVTLVIKRILQHAPNPTVAQTALARAAEEGAAELLLHLHGRPTSWLVQMFSVTDAQGITIGRGQIWKDITADREIDRMKASLMATVSHELRTPLAAIKGYVSTLLADDVDWDPESQRDFLTTISEETDRLSALVDDLLDLSRLEGGNLKIHPEAIDIEELIISAAQNAHPSPGENLEVYVPDDLPMVFADPRHIRVVLRNLIENAVKYGGEGRPVRVSVSAEPGRILVRVEDEGPGIPPEHIPHIFDSFYRVEDGLTRQASGAGLGLAICRGFVEAHGGKIWVEPRARGTCMTFSLPLISPGDAPFAAD